MTHFLDEQLRRTFDTLGERVRATVAEHSTAAVDQLAGLIESERRAAADIAARDAAATATRETAERLNESFLRREADAREAARKEGFDAGLQHARSEALALQDARVAEEQARADAASRRAEELASALAAAKAAAAQAAADHESALTAAAQAVTSKVDRQGVDRLLEAVQNLDRATSLSQTLDVLASAAEAEAERAAVFLVRGDVLRAWQHRGFAGIQSAAGGDVPLADAGIAADTIHTGAPHRTGASGAGRPAFANDAPAGPFVAVPLTMNGQVIALLCGEEPNASDAGEWLSTSYEILARHAARVLESLTALRLAQLGSHVPVTTAVSPPR